MPELFEAAIMVERNWNELLSAHLDGETSPDEQALIERELQQSPELQASWDDLQTMSLLVRSLPRDTAPAGLQTAVMQAVAPVSRPTAQPVAVVAAPSTKRSLKREWTVVGAASLLSCAATVVMMASLQTASLKTSATSVEFDSDALQLGVESRTLARDGEASFGRFAAPSWGVATSSVDARGEEAEQLRSVVTLADETPSLAKANEALAEANSDDGLARQRGTRAGKKLEQARVGDVVWYFEPNSNSVACVEVVVVDRQLVAKELQLLLKRNGAPTLPVNVDNNQPSADAFAEKAGTAGPNGSDLFAVFAQAPAEGMAQTLDEVADNDMVVSLQLQPPFEIESLGDVTDVNANNTSVEPLKQQIADAYVAQVLEPLAEQNEGLERWNDAERKLGEQAAKSTGAKDKTEDARPRRFSQAQNRSNQAYRNSGAKEATQDAPVSATNSLELQQNFNYTLQIPVPALEQKQANNRSAQFVELQNAFRRKTNESLAMKKLSNDTLAGSPIRVLFVLRPVEAPAQPTPAAPRAP